MALFNKIATALIALFFAVFALVPLVTLGGAALTGKPPALLEKISQGKFLSAAQEMANGATLNHLQELWKVRRYRRAAWNTVRLGLAVATLASLLALPISWSLGRRLGGLRRWSVIFLLPLALHPYLYAFAIILIFGHRGLFERMVGVSPIDPFSVGGLILTQTAAYFPLALLVQTPALASYRSGWSLAGKALGAGGFFGFRHVWLPLNSAGLWGGWLLVALRSMADFMTPMLLTSARFRVLVLEAWRDLAGSNWWPGAACLSLELLAFTAVLLWLERKVVQPYEGAQILQGEPEPETSYHTSWRRMGLNIYAGFLMLLPAAGLLIIAGFSLGGWAPSDWSGRYYRETAHELSRALSVSLELGAAVVLGSLASSLALSAPNSHDDPGKLRLAIRWIAALAFVLPSTVYAISLIGVFNRPPLYLHFTPTLLILALIATRMNYALNIVTPACRALGQEWQMRAAAFGATALLRWRWAVFPHLRPALAASAALIFVSSVQDIALAILIAPPRFYPLSLVIGRNIADGLFSHASAMAIVLVMVLIIPLILTAKHLSETAMKT